MGQHTELRNLEIPLTSKAGDAVEMASGSSSSCCEGGVKQQGSAHQASARWKQQGMERSGKVTAVTQQLPGSYGNVKLAQPVNTERASARAKRSGKAAEAKIK